MDLGEHKIDIAKREDGEWVDEIPEMGDLRLLVRGSDNKQWRKRFDALVAAVPRKKRINGLDPDERDRINAILLRDTCLLGWENLSIGGVPVPYSKEKANELLTEPQWAVFRNAVSWASSVVGTERAAEVEAIAGN